MLIFTGQNQVRLSLDFSPRERTDPVLPGLRLGPRAVDSLDFEAEPAVFGEMFGE